MDIDEILKDRGATHGAFNDQAALAQALKAVMRRGRNWEGLAGDARESLEAIATKISRILTGDAEEADHWNDIAGYARLIGGTVDAKVETGITRLVRRLQPEKGEA